MKLGVIGLGHVGLCLAGFLARKFEVIGMDIDSQKLELLRQGRVPFYEPGLDRLLKRASINYTSDLEFTLKNCDAIFICLPTKEFEPILRLASQMGCLLNSIHHPRLIVIRSTVLPGITRKFAAELIRSMEDPWKLQICSNPEFLSEGNALRNLYYPDRLIIGEINPDSGSRLIQIYEKLYGARFRRIPLIRCSLEEAELIKYATNAFLSLKISFINLMADVCESLKIDVGIVARGMGMDPRIRPEFLNAGLGFGGSCLPQNLSQLIDFITQLGMDPKLLEAVQQINSKRYLKPIEAASSMLGGISGRKISILGAAFKPNTDDIRESVSIKIIRELLQRGARVAVHDPVALHNLKSIFGDEIQYADSIPECLRDSDFCIIVTEWDDYRRLSSEDFNVMKTPIVYDGRRALQPSLLRSIKYLRLGTGR